MNWMGAPTLRQNERSSGSSEWDTRLAETSCTRRNWSSSSGAVPFPWQQHSKAVVMKPISGAAALWPRTEQPFSPEGTPGFLSDPVAHRKNYCLNRGKSLIGIHVMKWGLGERPPANTGYVCVIRATSTLMKLQA